MRVSLAGLLFGVVLVIKSAGAQNGNEEIVYTSYLQRLIFPKSDNAHVKYEGYDKETATEKFIFPKDGSMKSFGDGKINAKLTGSPIHPSIFGQHDKPRPLHRSRTSGNFSPNHPLNTQTINSLSNWLGLSRKLTLLTNDHSREDLQSPESARNRGPQKNSLLPCSKSSRNCQPVNLAEQDHNFDSLQDSLLSVHPPKHVQYVLAVRSEMPKSSSKDLVKQKQFKNGVPFLGQFRGLTIHRGLANGPQIDPHHVAFPKDVKSTISESSPLTLPQLSTLSLEGNRVRDNIHGNIMRGKQGLLVDKHNSMVMETGLGPSLIDVSLPSNHSQLQLESDKLLLSSKKLPPNKENAQIIMSYKQYRSQLPQYGNSNDWSPDMQAIAHEKNSIDPESEYIKQWKSFLRSKALVKREAEERPIEAKPEAGSDLLPQKNTSSVGSKFDDHMSSLDRLSDNASLSDPELSYRFRGMVGLVDDSRLPAKHLDNSPNIEPIPTEEPSVPTNGITALQNESRSPSEAATNHSSLPAINEPINTTKLEGTAGPTSREIFILPSVSSDIASNDQKPYKDSSPPIPEADKSAAENDPEPETEFEIDIDFEEGVLSGVEPEAEVEPEDTEDDVDMGIDIHKDDEEDTVIIEDHNEEGEYLGHVDLEAAGSEPEPETEPTSEPEGADADSGCIEQCYAEPAPEWQDAKETWSVAWEIHVYLFGIIFAVLALYAFISIIRLGQRKNLLSQGYFISLNVMLLVLCTSRAILLLIDGYNSNGTFHPVVSYVLYSIGVPCLTSAFSILFLALLKTMKMQLLSPKIQKPQVLIAIIIFHFGLSVSTDMIIGYFFDGRIASTVCQSMSLVWGAMLCIGYLYVFKRLFVAAKRRQKEMMRISESMNNLGQDNGEKKQPKLMLNLAIKVTFITALFGIALIGLHIYGMVVVINVFSKTIPGPWEWWGMHTGLRLTEIGMCITMSYVATQPFRYHQTGKGIDEDSPEKCKHMTHLIPCFRLCSYGSYDAEDYGQHLQMTAHQDNLIQIPIGYSNINLNEDIEAPYEITETPELDADRKQVAENKMFGVVDPETGVSGNKLARPTSMLIKEGGVIRFRQDWDPVGDPIGSTDDELNTCAIKEDTHPATTATPNDSCVQDDNDEYHHNFARYYQPHKNGHNSKVLDREGNVTSPVNGNSRSVPNTGANTPATPRSFCSTDAEGMFIFRPPSSIHLRESIEGALDYSRFSLKSPDYYGTQDMYSLPHTPDNLDERLVYPRGYFHKRKFSETDIVFGFRLKRRPSQLSRASKRSCQSDRKTPDLPWSHTSPRQYWETVKAKGSSVSLNLATPCSSGYSPLDDGEEQFTVADVRNYLIRSSLYRSNSDSLTHIRSENCERGTDV